MRNTVFNIVKMIFIHTIMVYVFAGEVIWGRLYILLPGFLAAWFLSDQKAWAMRIGFAITVLFCIGNSVTMTFWGLPFSINFLASASGKATILSEFVARLPYFRFAKILLIFALLILLFFFVQIIAEKRSLRGIFRRKGQGSRYYTSPFKR